MQFLVRNKITNMEVVRVKAWINMVLLIIIRKRSIDLSVFLKKIISLTAIEAN